MESGGAGHVGKAGETLAARVANVEQYDCSVDQRWDRHEFRKCAEIRASPGSAANFDARRDPRPTTLAARSIGQVVGLQVVDVLAAGPRQEPLDSLLGGDETGGPREREFERQAEHGGLGLPGA